MINGDEFQQLELEINSLGVEAIASTRVAELLTTIKTLDVQLLIAQNALELSLTNIGNVVPDIAQKVMSMCGRTDQKTKKKVAELAAGLVSQCDDSVQTYLAKAMMDALSLLGVDLGDLTGEATEESNDEWTPHNHD